MRPCSNSLEQGRTVCEAWMNVPLNSDEQARPQRGATKPTVISSDLDRALHTAHRVADALGVERQAVQAVPWLRPMHLGEAEGVQTSADFVPVMERAFRHAPNSPLPGLSREGVPGEAPAQFVASRLAPIQQLMRQVGSGTIDFGRHGATAYNNADKTQERLRGSLNIPLSAEGRQDALGLAQRTAADPPHVYASTHFRIKQLVRSWMQAGVPQNLGIDTDYFLSHVPADEPGTVLRVRVENGLPVRWENLDKNGQVVESGETPRVESGADNQDDRQWHRTSLPNRTSFRTRLPPHPSARSGTTGTTWRRTK